MSIKVNLHPYLRRAAGGQESVFANGKTVRDVFNDIERQYPGFNKLMLDEKGEVNGLLEVFINDSTAYPGELTKKINDGDEITILTLAGGG